MVCIEMYNTNKIMLKLIMYNMLYSYSILAISENTATEPASPSANESDQLMECRSNIRSSCLMYVGFYRRNLQVSRAFLAHCYVYQLIINEYQILIFVSLINNALN